LKNSIKFAMQTLVICGIIIYNNHFVAKILANYLGGYG